MATQAIGPLYSAPLLGGDDGTAQTIDALRSIVDDAWKDSFVNRTAIEILRQSGATQYDSWSQVRAIYTWVLQNFYFVNDPVMKEALRPARDLLDMRAGDCDDINAIVLPSLLGTIGYETRLITIAANPSDPSAFSHVYAEVNIDGDWVPIDAARPGTAFGSPPPRWYRREWWSLVDGSHEDYPGPGQISPIHGMSGGLRRTLGAERLRPALGLAGYPRLGDFEETAGGIAAIVNAGANVARSVSGQSVLPVVGGATAPGGYALASSPSYALAPSASSSMTPLLIIGALGLVVWAMMR